MNTFRIYCGLDTKGRLTLDQARETALGLACDYFPHGHTIIEATGRWQQDNAPVTEPTIIIEVLTTYANEEAKVRNLAGGYKALAFQESVLITKTAIDADFV
jgi:hypothetical protein